MTFLEAAVRVLGEAREPLSAPEITALALKKGWISSRGLTPSATVAAHLYIAAKQGDPRIERVFHPGKIRAKPGSVRWRLKSR